MPQHVRVYLHIEVGGFGRALNHCLKASRRKRGVALAHKNEGGADLASRFKPPQGAKFAPGERMRSWTALFHSTDVQVAAFQVDLLPAQVPSSDPVGRA